MNNFVLTKKGAIIEITNNSVEQILTNKEGFISPTFIPSENAIHNETIPAFAIQIPSFVSYKVNTIEPGNSISFVVTKPDEVFYYIGLADAKMEGISISVTPITDDTTLQDKTITPQTEEQIVTADEGFTGLGTVTVEAVTSDIDSNLISENIKKDVEILGVTGSYGGNTGAKGFVTFYNAKMKLEYIYDSDAFMNLNSMPPNPIQHGLSCLSWNWTLSDSQDYVSKYGNLIIGQMYSSENENVTKLYVTITDSILSPTLAICPNGTLNVDWGDNSNTEIITGSSDHTLVYTNHTYASAGSYVITLSSVDQGTLGLSSNSNETILLCKDNSSSLMDNEPYFKAITDIYIGNNVSYVDNYVFYNCTNTLTVVMLLTDATKNVYFENASSYASERPFTIAVVPNNIVTIENGMYTNCSYESVVVHNNVTAIGESFSFSYGGGATGITIPNSVVNLSNNAFSEVDTLKVISLPNSISRIGNSTFYYNGELKTVTIPDSVISIGDWAFASCDVLTTLVIPNSVTDIGQGAFASSKLTTVAISNAVTNLSNAVFRACANLATVTLPEQLISIGDEVFRQCEQLQFIKIPNSVISIGDNAFGNCSSLEFIEFLPSTPPTVETDTFFNIPTTCVISVPNGALSAYKTANNYPDPTIYTYVERLT